MIRKIQKNHLYVMIFIIILFTSTRTICSRANAETYANTSKINSNGLVALNQLNLLEPQMSTIRVGHGPVAVAVNPNTNSVYIANTGSKTISVINGSDDDRVIDVITIPSVRNMAIKIHDLAVNPTTNIVYVSATYEDTKSVNGTIFVIDGKTNKNIIKRLDVHGDAADIAVNPTTNKVYVTNPLHDSISIIYGKVKYYLP